MLKWITFLHFSIYLPFIFSAIVNNVILANRNDLQFLPSLLILKIPSRQAHIRISWRQSYRNFVDISFLARLPKHFRSIVKDLRFIYWRFAQCAYVCTNKIHFKRFITFRFNSVFSVQNMKDTRNNSFKNINVIEINIYTYIIFIIYI